MPEFNAEGLQWNVSVARADKIFRNSVERGVGAGALNVANFKSDALKLFLGERITNVSVCTWRLTESEKYAIPEADTARKKYRKCGVICSEIAAPGYATTGALQGLRANADPSKIELFFTTYARQLRTGNNHPDIVVTTIKSLED